MRGIPEFNFPAFMEAAEELRSMGHTVFNPAERDIEIGFTGRDAEGNLLTGNEDLAELGFSLRDALAADLAYICKEAEGVVFLPGWSASSGARAERSTASALGLPTWLDCRHAARRGGTDSYLRDYEPLAVSTATGPLEAAR